MRRPGQAVLTPVVVGVPIGVVVACVWPMQVLLRYDKHSHHNTIPLLTSPSQAAVVVTVALTMESQPPAGPPAGESNTASAGNSTITPAAPAVPKGDQRRRSSLELAFGIFSKKSKTAPLLHDAEPPSPGAAHAPAEAPSNPPESHSITTDLSTTSTGSPPSSSAEQTPDTAASASTTKSDASPAPPRRRSSLPKTIIDAVGRAASDSLLLVTTVTAPRRHSSGVNSIRIAPDPGLPTLVESQYSEASSPPPSLPPSPINKVAKEEESPSNATAAGDSAHPHPKGLRSSSESIDDILNRKPAPGPGTSAGISLSGSLRRMSLVGQQMIHALVANPEESSGKGNPSSSGGETPEVASPADATPGSLPTSADMSRMSSKISMRQSFRAIRSGIFGNRGSASVFDSATLDQPPPYLDRRPTVSDLRKYILLRKSFLKYCDVYHPCQEKVLFLVALDEFLALQEDDMVGQAAKMKAIDTDFILEGSKYDIGLGRVIRNTISKKAERYLQQSNLFWGTAQKDGGGGHGKREKQGKKGEVGSTDAKKPGGKEKGDLDNISQIDSDGGSSDDSDEEEEEVVAIAALPTVARKEVYALAEKEVEEYLTEFVMRSYHASDLWAHHVEPWLKAREELSKGCEEHR